MYTKIESYGFVDGEYTEGDFLYNEGCSCCSSTEIATPQNVEEAIREAREWIATLESLKSKLP